MDQMTPGNPAYGMPVGYRLSGQLDKKALEDSFNEVIKRHEVLRTTFHVSDGEPQQIIHAECKIKIAVTELDHLPAAEVEKSLHVLTSQEAVVSFDLSRLPLLRASLFKLGEADHVLLINFHHIVADGTSLGLFLNELDVFYRVFTRTHNGSLPDLTTQYADFAVWQRQTVDTRTFTRQIEFWRQKLQGRLPVLELPGDLQRQPVQSFRGSNVFAHIPTTLARRLSTLGAREGCTLFTTLLAAFQVLLGRYSGADDILLGTPLSVRTAAEVEPLVGNFLNMIVLRCDLTGDPTFVQVLRRSRGMTLHAFSKSELPFEKVVEHLTFERDPSRNPIFQVMIEVLPAVRSDLGNLQLRTFYFDLGFSQFDLSLHIWEESHGYVCRFEYCSDLFKADTIERFSSNFVQLLSAVVDDPQQRISKIPILTDWEKSRVLTDWNNTARDYTDDCCIHQLIERVCADAPGRVAIESGGQTLTYGELNARANQLAHHLIECGVKPEELIGLYIERSANLVVGLLGILKAGASYVPMDPLFPPDRLTYMMEDACIGVLVTQTDLLKTLPRSERQAICLDAYRSAIEHQSRVDPGLSQRSSSLAYTIYTSGSSGRPKGVMIEHRSVVNFLTSMRRQPGFDESDVLVSVTTISFDIAALEMFLPLISGGKLVIATKSEATDGSLLINLMQRTGATVLQATPSTWKLLLDANWKGSPDLKMLCGGEALPRELADRLLEGSGELWNMYGPTETTIWSSVLRIEPTEDSVLIGPPIANTQFYIVDQELQPVPIGVVGELLIGGDGLSRGYLNRPELTAERFVENPLIGRQGRVYKTGDLARFRPDGRIEFMGRRDFQVKVRGYRIELQEIEHALAQHEGVKDVAVLTWEDSDGDKRLVAYYIPSPDQPPTTVDLRECVQKTLPNYMCPSFFVEMQEFPCTPNGKIDRKAFPKPDVSVPRGGSNGVAPQGELEVQLAAIWRTVLQRPAMGADANFFELGGHSLLAARLFAQIEKKLGVTLPLALLLQAPTIRKLAEKIAQKSWKSSWNSLVPIQSQGQRPPLFLIHGAEGNILLYRGLAQTLGSSQPLYGLQSQGLDGREPAEPEIESIAARYIEEIKSAQPTGPYYLGGYCLGGTIALEIAQRLMQAGDSVAMLAMIETYNVKAQPPPSFLLKKFHKAQGLFFQVRNLLLSLSEGSVQFFKEKLEIEISRLKLNRETFWAKILNRFNSGAPLRYQHLQIQILNHHAQEAYEPAHYDGRIILFRPKSHFYKFTDACFGWGAVAKQGVQVVEMPNYPRGSLNDPFVKILAEGLEREIDRTLHISQFASTS